MDASSVVSICCPGPSLDDVTIRDLRGIRVLVSSAIFREDLRPDAWASVEGPDRWLKEAQGWVGREEYERALVPWRRADRPELWVPYLQRRERKDHKDRVLCRGWANVFPELPLGEIPADEDINNCMPWVSAVGSWCQWSFLSALSIALWRGAREVHLFGVDQEGSRYAKGCEVFHHEHARPGDGFDRERCFEMRWIRERKVTDKALKECREHGIYVVRHTAD